MTWTLNLRHLFVWKNWNLCTLNIRAGTMSLDFIAVFPRSWQGKVRFYRDTIPSTIPRPPVKNQTKVRPCQQAGVIKNTSKKKPNTALTELFTERRLLITQVTYRCTLKINPNNMYRYLWSLIRKSEWKKFDLLIYWPLTFILTK